MDSTYYIPRVKYGSSWPKAQAAAMQRSGGVCQRCKESKAQHVHHLLPIRYFEHPDDANFDSNLIAVCRSCHTEEHRTLAAALPLLDLLEGQRNALDGITLNLRVSPELLGQVERYWRFETSHRHLSDAARELLEAGIEVMRQRRAAIDAARPEPPA